MPLSGTVSRPCVMRALMHGEKCPQRHGILLAPLYLRPHLVRKPFPGLRDRRDVCTDGTEAKLCDLDLLQAADILHDLLRGAREGLALAPSDIGALQEADAPIGTYFDLVRVLPCLCAYL